MPALPLPRAFPIPPMSSAPAGATLTPCPSPAKRSSRINYGTGFDQFTANLRLSKTFAFGKEVQGGGTGGGGGGGGATAGAWAAAGSAAWATAAICLTAANTTNRRFNLTFSVSARNIFNNVNYRLARGQPQFSHLWQTLRLGWRVLLQQRRQPENRSSGAVQLLKDNDLQNRNLHARTQLFVRAGSSPCDASIFRK